MTEEGRSENGLAAGRFQQGVIGATAGLSLWFCFSELPYYVDSERLLAFLAAFLMILFSSILLMTGPLALMRAAAAGAALALIGAALFLWASFRFVALDDFMETGHSAVALGLLSLITLPFLVTAQLPGTDWRDYDRLFDQAWSMFVRGVIGAMFSGLFWMILVASDALLSLVGIIVIATLMEQEWFAAGFTGATFGLALGVLNEQQRIVSTVRGLALRLLRLLLPVVSVVGAVFVIMLPIRGLDQVFGDLSAAGTLIAMAMVGISLVAAAVDGTDEAAAASRVMSGSARLMCVIVPVIAGLALYALWIRVSDYGWTPERITGVVAAGTLCGYGLWHIASLARGGAWRGLIRTGNTIMALTVIGLSALLLTPVLNPERISANDQVDRFEAGLSTANELPLWDLWSNWGTAGSAAWERLETMEGHPQQALLNRLMREAVQDDATAMPELNTDMLDLRAALPAYPEGVQIPDGYIEAVPEYYVTEIHAACGTRTSAQHVLCAAVVGDFSDDLEGMEVILVWGGSESGETRFATLNRTGYGSVHFEAYAGAFGAPVSSLSAGRVLRDIADGNFAVRQPEFRVLDLGDIQILPPSAR
ncbi:MAG: DUF4153 domain-containing protein [Alphaproteobacteria bacterium]